MNNNVKPRPTGGIHWLEFLPDHVYCFLPSIDADKGEIQVHEHRPMLLDDFRFHEEIQVSYISIIFIYYLSYLDQPILFH